ncbi:YceK/YidQ family lipoprotein [Pseudomonas brassicacearum]|uniref:YceK/YidQ family lipoprotein n=1 Tax=Pseudomonas brassicacearum TaxID=930166 RepID=UPI001D033928|nr:YceK/YidQ family lipoprotein [Pseudomonas brassicacearum]
MAAPKPMLGGCAKANEISTNDNDVYLRALAPFAVVDLPFSIVADTLILPYTIFHMRPAEE